jgi:hypothetical protein
MSEKASPQVFTLVLVALPHELDVTTRMKALLKRAKRSYGFQCRSVTRAEAKVPGQAQQK